MRLPLVGVLLALAAELSLAQVSVLTDNYTNDRSNANLQETLLTPSNVVPGSFGKLGSFPVDGQVYAQPLYVRGVSIPGGGTHNVLYVTTEHNSVFAYDADSVSSPALLWQVNLGPSAPNTWFTDFADVAPEIGILSTGTIDPQAGVLYVVAEILQNSGPIFQLHALSIQTGSEMLNGPVTIAGQVAGTGSGSNHGKVAFDPAWHLQRPGLLLANGGVYITFGSHGDQSPWHGWLFRYAASDLSQAPGVFNVSPNGNGGAIWQSGRGLAADGAGNIYAISGNGDYDGSANFSESFLKFSGAQQPSLTDWYTPPNWQFLSDNDVDLAAGPALVPGTHLVVGGDKNGNLYLLNGDSMGHGPTGTPATFLAVQSGGIFNFALWTKDNATYVYVPELFSSFKCYSIAGLNFGETPFSQSTVTVDNPYVGMAISANGGTDGTGILWATSGNHSVTGLPGTLHAFDASNLGNELWNSDMAADGADSLGAFAKFANPTVVNGKVYVPTWSNTVTVYGMLSGSAGGGPAPSVAALANAASYAQNGVSPGEVVTLFGQNLADSSPLGMQLDVSGNVTGMLGNTQVFFDGMAAPMLYASPTQVSAIVPFGVVNSTTQAQVVYNGQGSNTLALPVNPATPGIFTADGSGMGQAAALNQDNSINSSLNPAMAGSTVVLYIAGAGQMNPPGQDGSVVSAGNLPAPVQDVSVTVGGQPATVQYAGGAPGDVEGVLQINVQLPDGVTGLKTAVVVTIGGVASGPGVTLAIQ